MKIKNVGLEIALTHLLTKKRQTIIAALGVTIGIGMFIFMNSLMEGFGRYARNEIFKSNAHLKIFREDDVSRSIGGQTVGTNTLKVIVNPALVGKSKALADPQKLLNQVRSLPYITYATTQVNVDAFFNRGESQRKGTVTGIRVEEANAMFNLEKLMLAGSIFDLKLNQNGVVLGKGIAEKLNLNLNDNLSISSSRGVQKLMRVVGIYSGGNKITDESRAYMNLAAAQQLAKQGTTYVTDIYANTTDPDKAPDFGADLQNFTEYKVEPWQVTNADILAGENIRTIMSASVSLTILLVAAFGIYNILNMIVSQKMNDIAILKATGFKGFDIIRIFVAEAFIMGLLGVLFGVGLGAMFVEILSRVYVGGPAGNFPIYFNFGIFVQGSVFGLLITLLAGYFPARKAAQVDPVSIFRK